MRKRGGDMLLQPHVDAGVQSRKRDDAERFGIRYNNSTRA